MAKLKSAIAVQGKPYRVVERLGFQHSAGVYVVIVRDEDRGEDVAVVSDRAHGPWRPWAERDRLAH